jgi:membrane protease YdiL (CAAX protease family)
MRTLRGSWAHLHPSRVILTFLMFMITGTMLGALLGMLIFPPDALRWIQAFNTIFTFLVPSWIMAFLVDERPGATWGRRSTLIPGTPLIAAGMMAMALPFIGFVTDLMSALPIPEALSFLEQMKEQTEAIFSALLAMDSFGDLAAAVIVMAFLPAWSEEAFFRGILFGQLQRRLRNAHATVWFTALFFAAVHLQWDQFPAILLLGGVLGYLRLYTGGIWIPAIAHFTNNAISVFMAYALIQKGKDPVRDPLYPVDFPIWLALLSAAIVILGVFFVKRLAAERQA